MAESAVGVEDGDDADFLVDAGSDRGRGRAAEQARVTRHAVGPAGLQRPHPRVDGDQRHQREQGHQQGEQGHRELDGHEVHRAVSDERAATTASSPSGIAGRPDSGPSSTTSVTAEVPASR